MTKKLQQTAFLSLWFVLLSVSAAADGVKGVIAQDFVYQDEPHPMRLPTAVAIGLADEVYVLDGVNDRVIAFHPDGQFASLIVPGGDVALRQPVGLQVAGDGRLWIADSGNGRIVVCTPAGVVEQTLVLPLADGRRADPTDLALSANGAALWIADNDNHRLLRFDALAGAWQVLGGPGEALGQWSYPFQVRLNQNGEIFATDVINSRVQMLGADGTPLRSIGTYGVEVGQLFRPGGLAVDQDNNIWVADSVTGVVQVLRRNGTALDALRDESDRPLHFESPLGLAFDRHEALYVVESRASRVRKLVISKTSRPSPPPEPQKRRSSTGQQAKACTICHFDWLPPFSEGHDSSLVARPIGTHDDPVVSRSEICLSCHDGTVADSRRRVWDEHGHRTGVVPSATMSIQAHLPLTGGKLACRTCHSAHGGDVPQGDFRRAVAVRVTNQSSELCASCHADKTGGPRFGTHPTDGMPWEIPAPLVEAGAKVGPNPRELTCQVCHTPHGAKFDQLLVMSAASNQMCLTCHERMRPGMLRDGAHAGHPLMAKVNAPQAAAVRDLGTRLGPESELICLSCHKLHHGRAGRFLLAEDLSEGRMCLRCHDGQRQMLGSPHDLRTNVPTERNHLGMTVADGGACSACHLSHQHAREMTPAVGDAAGQCLTCHREGACAENKRLGDINHPSVRCTECHDPHQVRFGSFLREPTDTLCSRCHSDKTLLFGGPHDSASQSPAWCDTSDKAGDRCLACHRPHGDERYGFFRVAPAGSQVEANGACIACHADTAMNGAMALLHPQSATFQTAAGGLPLIDRADGSRQIGCATCHDPHGGPAPGALLRTTSSVGAVELCVRCHTDMTQIVVTGHGPQALREQGLDSAACGPCHQVHGDARNNAERLLWPNALKHAGANAGDEYCLACHRDGGSAHPPAIATHPDVPMFDVAPTGAEALPLFDVAGQRDPHGTIGCRTCHLPHGRSMPEVLITAKRTPELRAQHIQLRSFEAPNACTSCHSVDALRRFLYFHDPERRGGVTDSR